MAPAVPIPRSAAPRRSSPISLAFVVGRTGTQLGQFVGSKGLLFARLRLLIITLGCMIASANPDPSCAKRQRVEPAEFVRVASPVSPLRLPAPVSVPSWRSSARRSPDSAGVVRLSASSLGPACRSCRSVLRRLPAPLPIPTVLSRRELIARPSGRHRLLILSGRLTWLAGQFSWLQQFAL